MLAIPRQSGRKQHSIVERVLKALTKKTAEKLVAKVAGAVLVTTPSPRSVDGSGYTGHRPAHSPSRRCARRENRYGRSGRRRQIGARG